MEELKELLLFKTALPVYAALIGAEIIFSHFHHRKVYTLKGTLTNFYLSFLNMSLDVLLRGVCLFVLSYFYTFRFFEIKNIYLYWFLLFIMQDLAFYVLHYADHYCRMFWAVHVTHHSSEEFNFTVGLRSSVLQPVYRFLYFIPLAFMGFSGMDIMFMYSASQLYGILIHTQYVGKLGFLEWFLATPSHHRVHHASNPQYLDRNMGMVLIIWDRLFGTFTEEKEPVKYGLTKNLDSPHHPVNVVTHEWKNLWKDIQIAANWKDRLRYLFYVPGWSHDGSRKTSRMLRDEYFNSREPGAGSKEKPSRQETGAGSKEKKLNILTGS